MASEASRLHLLIRDAGLSVPQQLPDPVVTDFSCDSRRIRPGTLFVACLVSALMAAVSGVRPCSKGPPLR